MSRKQMYALFTREAKAAGFTVKHFFDNEQPDTSVTPGVLINAVAYHDDLVRLARATTMGLRWNHTTEGVVVYPVEDA